MRYLDQHIPDPNRPRAERWLLFMELATHQREIFDLVYCEMITGQVGQPNIGELGPIKQRIEQMLDKQDGRA